METLFRSQKIPVPIKEAWNFFSSPANLSEITPANMDFRVLSEIPERIHNGLRITYRVRPMFRIPVKWVSLIENVSPPFSFTDKQIKGPYRYWSHLHEFREIPGGTEIIDKVTYQSLPGIAGKLADRLFVRQRLDEIFNYRRNTLIMIFGEYKA